MERDINKEKILEKMRELREKRDLKILKNDLDSINLDTDYQENLRKNKVKDVKFLGIIQIDGEEKGIFLVTEQKEIEEGKLIDIERYYTEDGEMLAGNNTIDGYELMLNEKFQGNENLLEELKGLDKEGILDLNELEENRKEQIAKALRSKKRRIGKNR